MSLRLNEALHYWGCDCFCAPSSSAGGYYGRAAPQKPTGDITGPSSIFTYTHRSWETNINHVFTLWLNIFFVILAFRSSRGQCVNNSQVICLHPIKGRFTLAARAPSVLSCCCPSPEFTRCRISVHVHLLQTTSLGFVVTSCRLAISLFKMQYVWIGRQTGRGLYLFNPTFPMIKKKSQVSKLTKHFRFESGLKSLKLVRHGYQKCDCWLTHR